VTEAAFDVPMASGADEFDAARIRRRYCTRNGRIFNDRILITEAVQHRPQPLVCGSIGWIPALGATNAANQLDERFVDMKVDARVAGLRGARQYRCGGDEHADGESGAATATR
jgi:hypothetical protein